jgi:hypothetical protein
MESDGIETKDERIMMVKLIAQKEKSNKVIIEVKAKIENPQ